MRRWLARNMTVLQRLRERMGMAGLLKIKLLIARGHFHIGMTHARKNPCLRGVSSLFYPPFVNKTERNGRMKRSLIIMALIVVAGVGCTEEDKKEVKVELESLSQKASYAVGLQIGRSMSTFPVAFDRAAFDAALDDSLAGSEPRLSREDLEAVFGEMNKIHQGKMAAAGPPSPQPASADGEKNLEVGKAFLEENAKKEGVVTMNTGLQYVVIKEGEGAKPVAADKVEVHYLGTTINGNEFDSSYKRGTPATFGVTQVIPGWTEALQLMTVGSKYKLFIPSNLAYGPRGAGRDIGPNETLIFEIELISIQK